MGSSHPLEEVSDTHVEDDSVPPPNKDDTKWLHVSPCQQPTALTQVDVYMGDFIKISHGGPTKRKQMMRHLLHTIEHIFSPNELVTTDLKDPISLKNMKKRDSEWSTRKVVLGWDIDIATQFLHLPEMQAAKV